MAKFSCCGMEFKDEEELTRHQVKAHGQQKKVVGSHCGQDFYTQSASGSWAQGQRIPFDTSEWKTDFAKHSVPLGGIISGGATQRWNPCHRSAEVRQRGRRRQMAEAA